MMFQRVVYRIVPNHACNDFNGEPKLIKLKYFVVGESKDGKSWLVETAGWRGKANRHYVKKSECTEVE